MKPTLIFIHGWCCQPSDFDAQVRYFENDYPVFVPNHSAVTADDSTQDGNSLDNLVDVLTQQIRAENLNAFILIGHSLGGLLALELAKHFPEALLGTVILDTTLPHPITQANKDLLAQLDKLAGKPSLAKDSPASADNEFDDPAQMKAKRLESFQYWAQCPRRFNEILKDAFELPKPALISCNEAPMLYIGGTPSRGEEVALKALKPDLQFVQVKAGHYVMLTCPNEVNALIAEFIKPLHNPD